MNMIFKPQKRANHTQSGLGLIEVLVALVVVSFGVLGMASLQLTGMKHSSGGFNRSKALLYAQNMATHIRINSAAVDGDGNLEYAAFDSSSVGCGTLPDPYCQARPGIPAGTCDAAQMAAFDLFTASCGDAGSSGADKGVIGTLPNGNLNISCLSTPCTADSAYEITVSWSEGRSRTNSDELITKRVQVRLRP